MPTWKDVPGFEGLYQVSNLGVIRGLCDLREWRSKSGYRNVTIHRNKKKFTYKLHCLITSAFLGPKPHGLEINHRDGNKQNNALDNLEYCTHAENMAHAGKLGLMQKGEKHFRKRHPELIPRGYHYTRPPLSDSHKAKLRASRIGSISPYRKLTFEQATTIRSTYSLGEVTLDQLAAQFNVSQRTIIDIIKFDKYKS